MSAITIGDGAFCITLDSTVQQDGAPIGLRRNTGCDSQRWIFEDGAIKLLANPQFCLNLHGFCKAHGALINLWTYTGHPSQKWDICGDKIMLHDDHRWVVNLHGMDLRDGATVYLWEDTGHASQLWRIQWMGETAKQSAVGAELSQLQQLEHAVAPSLVRYLPFVTNVDYAAERLAQRHRSQDELLDRIAGAVMGVFIGDALGMGVHWQYDLDKLETDRGYVTDYLTPLPGTYHSGCLKAGQLELQGAIDKLLLQSLAERGELDQDDFLQRFEDVILKDPSMDGTRKSGRYGWTDKCILDIWKKRIKQQLPWDQCVSPRSDTPDSVVRAALLAARYHKSPREMCCQVNQHAKAQTADSSVQSHSVAFACIVAGIIEGQALDSTIGSKLYAQCGTVLPFSNMHIEKDHDDRYGDYSEPDSLDWFTSMCKGLTEADGKFKFVADPAHRGVQMYGQACCFWETLSSAYYCVARHLGDFEGAVLCSVNGGGSNTVRSSLVGALMGASVGLSKIPVRFIEGLDDSATIVALAKQVAKDSMTGVEGDDWQWPKPERIDEAESDWAIL